MTSKGLFCQVQVLGGDLLPTGAYWRWKIISKKVQDAWNPYRSDSFGHYCSFVACDSGIKLLHHINSQKIIKSSFLSKKQALLFENNLFLVIFQGKSEELCCLVFWTKKNIFLGKKSLFRIIERIDKIGNIKVY